MQPLDVAVFGPMKRNWRVALREWKDEGVRKGEIYATIPKKVWSNRVMLSSRKNFVLLISLITFIW
jgi:hypothetical protein